MRKTNCTLVIVGLGLLLLTLNKGSTTNVTISNYAQPVSSIERAASAPIAAAPTIDEGIRLIDILRYVYAAALPVVTPPSVSPVVCPNSIRCYQIVRPTAGIKQADAYIQAQNHVYCDIRGVLSNWQSLAETTGVVSAFNRRGISLEQVWLAGNKGADDQWFWFTGSMLNYNYWAQGEPKNGYRETALLSWTHDGKFADCSPDEISFNGLPRGFLVEYAMQ